MSAETGGPAFPVPMVATVDGMVGDANIKGMSLRDYFAAKAMQAYRSNGDYASNNPEQVATWSYADADAMLAERSK